GGAIAAQANARWRSLRKLFGPDRPRALLGGVHSHQSALRPGDEQRTGGQPDLVRGRWCAALGAEAPIPPAEQAASHPAAQDGVRRRASDRLPPAHAGVPHPERWRMFDSTTAEVEVL